MRLCLVVSISERAARKKRLLEKGWICMAKLLSIRDEGPSTTGFPRRWLKWSATPGVLDGIAMRG